MMALVALSITVTFAACCFGVYAAFRVLNNARQIDSHADRIRSSVTRLCAVVASYLGIQAGVAAFRPAHLYVAGSAAAGLAVKVAASLFVPLWIGLGDSVVEHAGIADIVAITAENQQDLMLTDGSLLTLTTGAAINVDIERALRTVHLDHGQVRFKVAKDPTRPFLVQTPHATVRVLGTEFTVSSDAQGTNVRVHEGRVEVLHKGVMQLVRPGATVQKSPGWGEGLIILLTGGDTFVSADGKLHDQMVVNRSGSANASAAAEPSIEFKGELLSNVVAEISRHQKKPFIIVDPEIGAQQISGTLNPRDRYNAIDILKLFGVRVEEDSKGQILLYDASKPLKRAGLPR